MEHCTTSIIQDDLSELPVKSNILVKDVEDLIERVKNAVYSLEDLKLAARGVIKYYKEEKIKDAQLEKVLVQLENLIQE